MAKSAFFSKNMSFSPLKVRFTATNTRVITITCLSLKLQNMLLNFLELSHVNTL